ncbi:MAG: BON domain-containing protein [Burkholderiales bacterium]|nr:BON domain-containing protein [Burkholderiales bacterium]
METAKKAHEDRSTDQQWTDVQIASSVLSALGEKDKGLLLDVSADVWELRVLLTGTVVDHQTRQDLVRRVRADRRILKVYDEIQVVSQEEQARRRAASTTPPGKREGAERVVGDMWIETKISAQLISAGGVTSVNYRWRSVRGTVYLIGRAQTRQELATVLGLVRATDGVLQVRQFIEVRPNGKP